MDKKQLLWILLLSFAAAMLVQTYILPNRKADQQPTPPPASVANVDEPTDPPSKWIYGGRGLTVEQIEDDDIPTVRLGSVDPIDGYRFQLELDPRGAGIQRLKLTSIFETVTQKRTQDKTAEQYQDWSYSLIQPVPSTTNTRATLAFSTESIRINGEDVRTFLSPANRVRWEAGDDESTYGRIAWEFGEVVTDARGIQSVTATLSLYADADAVKARKPSYRLTKTYTVAKGSPSVTVKVSVANLTDQTQTLSVTQYGPAGIPREGLRADVRDAMAAGLITAEMKIDVPKGMRVERTKAVKDGGVNALGDNRASTADPVVWAGAGNQFFGCLMYPVPQGFDTASVTDQTPVADTPVAADQYTYAFSTRTVGIGEEAKSQLVEFTSDPSAVAAGEAATFTFDVYCGPKSNSLFTETPLYARLNYSKAIKFRTCNLCLIEPLAYGVMWVIERGGAAINNYGVIIILMVLLIRLVLHPITKRSQVSMMKMKTLQPEMQKIQEKYKDNKEAQQKAMMQFWKQTGASPFLGCLPMFLQMPIWIALWGGLSASVVLRHQGLLPFWITDLAGPDTVISLAQPLTLPLIGAMIGPIHGLNILPLLLAVFMFLQQKLTPMQSAAGASPDQQKQQKMMMYMMSGMMLLFFYNAPSGLTLYIMASTGGGVLESFVIRKHIREKEALQAASETLVDAPGKAARGQRPKKPKGPFKM